MIVDNTEHGEIIVEEGKASIRFQEFLDSITLELNKTTTATGTTVHTGAVNLSTFAVTGSTSFTASTETPDTGDQAFSITHNLSNVNLAISLMVNESRNVSFAYPIADSNANQAVFEIFDNDAGGNIGSVNFQITEI